MKKEIHEKRLNLSTFVSSMILACVLIYLDVHNLYELDFIELSLLFFANVLIATMHLYLYLSLRIKVNEHNKNDQ